MIDPRRRVRRIEICRFARHGVGHDHADGVKPVHQSETVRINGLDIFRVSPLVEFEMRVALSHEIRKRKIIRTVQISPQICRFHVMKFAESDVHVRRVVRVDENVARGNFSVRPREKPVKFDGGDPVEIIVVIDHHVFPYVILRTVVVVAELFISEFFGKRPIHHGDLHGRVVFHAVFETIAVVHRYKTAVIRREKEGGRKKFESERDRNVDDKTVKRNIPYRFRLRFLFFLPARPQLQKQRNAPYEKEKTDRAAEPGTHEIKREKTEIDPDHEINHGKTRQKDHRVFCRSEFMKLYYVFLFSPHKNRSPFSRAIPLR